MMDKKIIATSIVFLLLPLTGCVNLNIFGDSAYVASWERSDGKEEIQIKSDNTGAVIKEGTGSYTFTWTVDPEQEHTFIWCVDEDTTKLMRYYLVADDTILVLYQSGGTPWAYYKVALG